MRPVHAAEQVGCPGVHSVFKNDVSVFEEPGVQVKRAVVRGEAVVGQDEQRAVCIQLHHSLTQHSVHLFKELHQPAGIFRRHLRLAAVRLLI